MGKSRTYTDEAFKEAVINSISIREVLRRLNLRQAGGNYFCCKKRIKEMGLDISHFLGKAHLKGKTHNWTKKIPLDKILINDSHYGGSSSHLKKRLIKEGLLEDKCYECNLREWMGKPLVKEIEHKNGNKFDNRIENLTILCPNCHSQTSTFRGRNNHAYKGIKVDNRKNPNIMPCKSIPLTDEELTYKVANETFDSIGEQFDMDGSTVSRICKKRNIKIPSRQYKKKFDPSKEELSNIITKMNFCQAGKYYGVSDNAVRKRCKKFGLL